MLFSARPRSPISLSGSAEMRSAYRPSSMRRAARVMRWMGRTSIRASCMDSSTASSTETPTTTASIARIIRDRLRSWAMGWARITPPRTMPPSSMIGTPANRITSCANSNLRSAETFSPSITLPANCRSMESSTSTHWMSSPTSSPVSVWYWLMRMVPELTSRKNTLASVSSS